MMRMTRRSWLKQSTLALTALCARVPGAEKKIPVGLQLYSVRKEAAQDLAGVLKQVAAIGYRGVEFAGYHGRNAKELRAMLDEVGLVCCGTHTPWASIQEDQLQATMDFNEILGNPYLIVPSLPKDRLATPDACKQTAEILTRQAERAARRNMYVGYHAHGGDFKKFPDGTTPWEIIFTHAAPNVVMQLDTGNCMGGGGDPVAILQKFAGRALTIHLKEHGGPRGAPIGEGQVPWDKIFELCETVGGTRWYIVEHESSDQPLQAVRACFENLKRMGKV